MTRRILIIQGHPDPDPARLCRALARAYEEGATAAGHEVRTIDIAAADVPVLRSSATFHDGHPPPDIAAAQAAITAAEHLVIVYPLWLGTMPALLKAFLEQVFRPDFAFDVGGGGLTWKKRLKGRSARVVVTMGMPALAYRWFFRAHSLKSLERNILKFCGIAPVRETLVGSVEALSAAKVAALLERMRNLGAAGR